MSILIQRTQTQPVTPPLPAFPACSQSEQLPPQEIAGETLKTPILDALHKAISAEPELRPSEVARAIIWARDPNYPPLDALNNIASAMLANAIRHL